MIYHAKLEEILPNFASSCHQPSETASSSSASNERTTSMPGHNDNQQPAWSKYTFLRICLLLLSVDFCMEQQSFLRDALTTMPAFF
eukprot:763400-Hanusia_phi.AAC.5